MGVGKKRQASTSKVRKRARALRRRRSATLQENGILVFHLTHRYYNSTRCQIPGGEEMFVLVARSWWSFGL